MSERDVIILNSHRGNMQFSVIFASNTVTNMFSNADMNAAKLGSRTLQSGCLTFCSGRLDDTRLSHRFSMCSISSSVWFCIHTHAHAHGIADTHGHTQTHACTRMHTWLHLSFHPTIYFMWNYLFRQKGGVPETNRMSRGVWTVTVMIKLHIRPVWPHRGRNHST